MQPLCKTLTASNLLLQSYSHLKNRHHRQPRTKLLRKFKVFFPMRATHQCHKIKTKFPLPSPMQCCFGVKTNPDNSCVTQNSIGRGEGEYGYFCRNGCYLCYSSELHENVANFQIFSQLVLSEVVALTESLSRIFKWPLKLFSNNAVWVL